MSTPSLLSRPLGDETAPHVEVDSESRRWVALVSSESATAAAALAASLPLLATLHLGHHDHHHHE